MAADPSEDWSPEFPDELERRRKRFRVERDATSLQITWDWASAAGASFLFLLGFGLSGFIYFMFLRHRFGNPKLSAAQHSSDVLMLLLPIAMYGYPGLAALFNKTVIRVDAARLSARSGPMPWDWPRDVSTADVGRVYCEEYKSWGRAPAPVLYRIKAVRRDASEVKLVDGLGSPSDARFIVEQLKAYLRL
ncbi:MAG TPA: hypothetical protein VNI01_10650 [Elusimicrobiota bacterium]|nr:hypothetical protein [Elusimicrobiota bacterium]